MAFRGPKVWLWRWRRNPLKRRADMVESWVVLGVWALTVLAGVLAGWATAGSVEDGLARERVEWRPLMGRLTDRAPGKPAASGSASGDRVWAKAGWTGPDGSAHTGQVRVGPGSAAGTPVTVWTDTRGRMVTEPVGAAQAGCARPSSAVWPASAWRRCPSRAAVSCAVAWNAAESPSGTSTGPASTRCGGVRRADRPTRRGGGREGACGSPAPPPAAPALAGKRHGPLRRPSYVLSTTPRHSRSSSSSVGMSWLPCPPGRTV